MLTAPSPTSSALAAVIAIPLNPVESRIEHCYFLSGESTHLNPLSDLAGDRNGPVGVVSGKRPRTRLVGRREARVTGVDRAEARRGVGYPRDPQAYRRRREDLE